MRWLGRHERAFSLLEMAIGSSIALCVVLGTVVGLFRLASLSDVARDTVVAVNDASAVMEQITETAFSDIAPTDWTQWAKDHCCADLKDEQVKVTTTARNADLLEIAVKMDWKTKNRPMSIRLATLRTRE